MIDLRPGLDPRRLVELMRTAIARCRLDLSGAVVLTEAASGAYVVTPVLAALAGARQVFAVCRSTRYGSFEEISANTQSLAELAGVESRLTIIAEKTREIVGQADIVTNSGHVRPIDAEMVNWMKPRAVIPLMYESWEFRDADLDLAACRKRGILVAGTNERHPAVDVFTFLGDMALKLLLDMGVAVSHSRILLLCDNNFAPFIERGLGGAGASVSTHKCFDGVAPMQSFDAILVAMKPTASRAVCSLIDTAGAAVIARRWPGTPVAQFFGDVNRAALQAEGVPVWPKVEPASGHMGILPSDVGPEPIVRLQSGGLKVAEILLASHGLPSSEDKEFIDEL